MCSKSISRRLIVHPLLSGAILCLSVGPTQVAAQESSQGDSQSTDEGSALVCMARVLDEVAQVPAAKRGQRFRIIAIERIAPSLEAKGFERADCSTADLASSNSRNSWRNEICELASTGNEAVQNQLERAYGERPAVLCAAAELVAGQWQRPGKRKGQSQSK